MEMIELQIQIFLLAVVGFVLGKKNILNMETKDHLVDVILMVVLPCSILEAFEMELSPEILVSTLNVLLISCGIQVFYWVWNHIFYRKAEEGRRICLKYATMVSNAGFIGMPVAAAVYGSLGLLYASVFLLPQRIFMWSYGLSMFTTVSSREVVKKVLTHPCIIAVFLGLVIMICYTSGIYLPSALSDTIGQIGGCSTALSMMLIGAILSDVEPKEMLNKAALFYSFYRLLLIPFLVGLLLWKLPLDSTSVRVSVLLTAMPAASTTVMLAEKYHRDYRFASELIMTSTILSLVTIPVVAFVLNSVPF